ncbi:ComF family protein [Merismopedia glauca]|uniref:ComF family protein n=1 Tax=Merismopedia glauca CCAP 1448/3 TaxID=1296344 RepID=A0A2T1C1A2_9CYAN|nr:ComF family protein [Merismopedia glauca]PSB02050.1 ComF family protein [Merismopedia glauca CCAP 1448/3]
MQTLLNIFLASRCPLCDRSANKLLCQYCEKQLESCQLENPQELWKGNLPVFVWGNYEGALKRAIASLKYDNKPEIGQLLGEWLGRSWLNSNLQKSKQKLVVVPIPLHSDKLRQRGYNQAAIIADTFAQITRLPYKERGLIRNRDTKAQFGLSIAQRQDNLANAFSLGKDFQKLPVGTQVLLIDDIYTTGATTQAAAQILRQSGITVLGLGAIATPQKPPKDTQP